MTSPDFFRNATTPRSFSVTDSQAVIHTMKNKLPMNSALQVQLDTLHVFH